MISRPFSLPEVLSRRVLSTTVGGGGISTISYCAAPPEFEDELEFLRSPPYSGDPAAEEEETVVTEDGGGGDELQLGTVPSLKPIQTAPKTTCLPSPSAVQLLLKCREERVRQRETRRERDHSNGGHSVHYYMARVQRKMSV